MIIQNALEITEKDKIFYLVSNHTHDYRTYVFADGDTISVDGGRDYLRRAYSPHLPEHDWNEWVDISLYDNSTLEECISQLLWGTKGESGKEPLKWVLLVNCTSEHLNNILKDREKLKIQDTMYEKVINHILGIK